MNPKLFMTIYIIIALAIVAYGIIGCGIYLMCQ